ncbi:capsid protein [Broad bean necrosis virus]|nr:capsid protein [Broad bean necrosis virus]BAA34695.1 capsid protein [Broad bean necrosis virus]
MTAAMEPHYAVFSNKMAKYAAAHPFIKYNELSETVKSWMQTRTSVMEHVNFVLGSAANLGTRGFFSRNVRFGMTNVNGDNLYADLGYLPFQNLLNALTIVLGAVGGRGKLRRNPKGESSKAAATEQINGGSDGQLNIAHCIMDINQVMSDPTILQNAVYSQSTFEEAHGLAWVYKPTA